MIARLSFPTFAALLVCALAFPFSYGANASPQRETLRLIQKCPASQTLCLEAELNWENWSGDKFGRVTYREHREEWSVGTITQDIVVRGRLAGGPPRIFLMRSERAFDDFQNPTTDLGFVAFYGRSSGNQPIILTDKGPFEILTKTVDVFYGAQVMMIGERSWKGTVDFLSWQTFVVTSEREVGIWDAKRKTCILAPTMKPGLLRTSRTACRARAKGDVSTFAGGNLTAALVPIAPMKKLFTEVWGLNGVTPSDDYEGAFSSFGGGGNGYDVFRIGKSHMLIITVDHDPC